MAISIDILTQIMVDFYTGPDSEVLNIRQEDPFWEWFRANAFRYTPCAYLDTLYSGQNSIAGNCFGNSQKVAVEEQIEYCEGFCKVKGIFILHGFNVFDNCVIDSTVQSNSDIFLDINNALPNEYYGVLVPTDLIEIALDVSNVVNYLNRSSKLLDFFVNNQAKVKSHN
jgi:hypothetical protein